MPLSAFGRVAFRFGVKGGRGCGTFGTPDEEGGAGDRNARSPFKSLELKQVSIERDISVTTGIAYLFALLFPENHFLNPLGSFLT